MLIFAGTRSEKVYRQTHSPKEITRLLVAWGEGDQSAHEELAPLVHSELYRFFGRLSVEEVAEAEGLKGDSYAGLTAGESVAPEGTQLDSNE